MATFRGKLLLAGLAALYGCVALLGHGLHELAPAAHSEAASAAHVHAGCHHHHHAHRHAPVPATPGWSDWHECDICIFLAQVRSEPPQLAAAAVWQHLLADIVPAGPRLIARRAQQVADARGPPSAAG